MGGLHEDPANLCLTTQCQRCEHFKGYSEPINDAACLAFPFGIPDRYYHDETPHRKVDPEQEGTFVYAISVYWRDSFYKY